MASPAAPAREQGQLEAAVERLQLRIADEIDHVEVVELGEDATDELAADALPVPLRQYLQERDEGAEDARSA